MTCQTDPQATGNSIQPYHWKVIASTSIANALEWFDFVAFGFFAVTMAKLFLPTSNDVAALLAIFATFVIPFAVRPIGAIVLGAYADRHGRKAALLISISLMTFGTAIMATVPTYDSIGVWAPVIVIAARMLQRFSVGGEYGPAVAFLTEQNEARRGFAAADRSRIPQADLVAVKPAERSAPDAGGHGSIRDRSQTRRAK